MKTIQDHIIDCSISNQMLAAGFSATDCGGALAWAKEIAPNVWAQVCEPEFGLGGNGAPLCCQLISWASDESRIWYKSKGATIEQCLRWTAWAERKLNPQS